MYCLLKHPRDIGTAEVEQFLTHLAVNVWVSTSSQNQAKCAKTLAGDVKAR
jgi:hypothetical protein